MVNQLDPGSALKGMQWVAKIPFFLLCFLLFQVPAFSKIMRRHALISIEIAVLKKYPAGIPITGIVKNENGEGFPAVYILIKGTSQGTTTDAMGNFNIEVPDNNAVLVFSFSGYKAQEVIVGSQTNFSIVMEMEAEMAQEVEVEVPYGRMKKSALTGANSHLAAKEIAIVPVANISSSLQGRAPGVIVTSNGAPGMSPVVRIRGNGSIGLSADPLYVIDGIPVTDPNFLNNFDSKDIESMEVLKDAASSAIYGSRASNGVIMVTTKKGIHTDKKLHFNLDSYTGVQSIWRKLDLLDNEQYQKYAGHMSTKGLPSRLSPQHFNQPIYPGSSQTYAQTNTDWQDALFRNAIITQTHVSVSGGTDLSRFYGSAGYFKQQGIMEGTGFNRANFRINSDHTMSKKISIGQTLTFSYAKRDNETDQSFTQGRSLIMHMIRSLPYLPVYDPTKLGGYRAADGMDGSDVDNPVKLANLFQDNATTAKLFGTVFIEYKITDGLKFKTLAGLDYSQGGRKIYLPIYNDGFNSRTTSFLSNQHTLTHSMLFSNQLSFDKMWGKHSVNAVAVAEQQSYNIDNTISSGDLSFNGVEQQNGLSNSSVNGTNQKNFLISYVGRVNYEFAGKYLLSATIRADGSSKFAPGNRWGTFPAASVGWRISEEKFMKSLIAINELKLRGSYGLLGFNGIGNYDWQAVERTDLTLYHLGGNNVNGSYFNALSNPDLKWETSKMMNVGIDFALLNNKFVFSADYFNKLTENLILPVNVAPSLGYSILPVSNVGSMKNNGLEFQAGYNIRKGGFKSQLSANIGFIRNKVLALNTPSADIQAGNNPDFGGYNITITKAGLPVQSFYGWEVEGIFQSEDEIQRYNQLDGNSVTKYQDHAAPGDIKFKDHNSDGKIDDNDRKVLGSYLPKFTYGFNYTANYKNFDLAVFFQGVHGNKIYNGTKVLTEGMTRLFNAGTNVMNAWTPENTATDVPRVASGDDNHNVRTSDRFLESGSYLRLKNVVLGYTLPETMVQSFTRGNLSKIRLYFTSTNLLTFTKYSGYDPEVALGPRLAAAGGGNAGTAVGVGNLLTNGIDYGQAPQPRSFIGGIQIGF